MTASSVVLWVDSFTAVMSDFGNGGQTIIDHATFAAVKESLTVLGAVGPNGINYQRLATHRSLWTSCKVMLGCTRYGCWAARRE